ncbi:pentapeptide repeat-containing protein [Kitasatospora paracochleata]|nr:pentapeptide repeat-containing protein [Kitasatospora paracochleata]
MTRSHPVFADVRLVQPTTRRASFWSLVTRTHPIFRGREDHHAPILTFIISTRRRYFHRPRIGVLRPLHPPEDARNARRGGARLSGVDLSGVDLSGSDLSSADLRGADLSGANLRAADLRGADLRGTGLEFADLTDVSLEGARWSLQTAWPDGDFDADIRRRSTEIAPGVFQVGGTSGGSSAFESPSPSPAGPDS